jgi:hypothetical protein
MLQHLNNKEGLFHFIGIYRDCLTNVGFWLNRMASSQITLHSKDEHNDNEHIHTIFYKDIPQSFGLLSSLPSNIY